MKGLHISRGMILLGLLSVFLCPSLLAHAASVPKKGFEVGGVEIKDAQGNKVGGYAGSYALLIGVSNYTSGWPRLENVPGELDKVEVLLRSQGFKVERWPKPGKSGPDGAELESAFNEFIRKYGYDKDNRLLFFFSGHGYTLDSGSRGYLVPTDAPDPKKDEKEFRRRALDMDQIMTWAKRMTSKHALFLFDSCFSGTIFKQKALPDMPPNISAMTTRPVRQFITAGSAEEKVPAKSTFIPMFIDAIKESFADYNKDGYVSGTELGMYLSNEVPKYVLQTPQYGTIQDYDLSRGDFVFRVGIKENPVADTGWVSAEPSPYKAWPLIADEKFTSASNPPWMQGNWSDINSTMGVSINDGKYRWDMSFQKPWARPLEAPYPSAVDFYVAVDVKLVESTVAEGVSLNLLFGRASQKDYRFTISSNNYFALSRADETDTKLIIDWTPTAVDLSKPNRLSVLVDNQTIKLFLNSVLVGEYRDTTFTGGKVGLALGSWGVGRVVAEFDNFEFHRKP